MARRMPLHEKIAADLRRRIRARELQAGDLLPSEAELCAEYSVSRSTVRQSLAALEAEGLVRKAQGRGSVVAPQAELHRDVARTGLSLQFGEGETKVTTDVLEYDIVTAPKSVPGLGGSDALRVVRRRSSDAQAFAVIRTWMPADFAQLITRESLVNASLHERFATVMGRPVAGGRRQVRAVAATGQVAAQLGTEEGTPLLLLEGESVDREGRLLESFQTWHRADLVAFDVESTPEAGRSVVSSPPAPEWAGDDVGERLETLEAIIASLQSGLTEARRSLKQIRESL